MTRSRDLGLDAVRGVAILSMFVAHFAPVAGPGEVLTLSEYLTAFLFVLLIGMGAELGRHSPTRWRSSQARALSLVVIGLLLTQLPMQIIVVLVWLGVMIFVATWLVELPWWANLGAAAAAVAVAPTLMTKALEWQAAQVRDGLSLELVRMSVGPHPYRLLAFVVPACAGVLLVRYATTDRLRLQVGAAAGAVAAALVVLDRAGVAALDPYTGTRQEIVFDTALALGVACFVWVLAPKVAGVGRALAALGVVALSVYVAQVVGDYIFFKAGGATDDSWVVLGGATAAALLFGLAWLPVARRTGWRGPVEGPIDALARGRWPRPSMVKP